MKENKQQYIKRLEKDIEKYQYLIDQHQNVAKCEDKGAKIYRNMKNKRYNAINEEFLSDWRGRIVKLQRNIEAARNEI